MTNIVKVLAAVSVIVEVGNEVVFTNEGSPEQRERWEDSLPEGEGTFTMEMTMDAVCLMGTDSGEGCAGDAVVSQEEGFEVVAEYESGKRLSERLRGLTMPTTEERRGHENHHLPLRSWCSHCVRGKGKEAPHRRQHEAPPILEFHVDCMLMGGSASLCTLTYGTCAFCGTTSAWRRPRDPPHPSRQVA